MRVTATDVYNKLTQSATEGCVAHVLTSY